MEFTSFVDDYYHSFVDAINKFDKSTLPAVMDIFTTVADAGSYDLGVWKWWQLIGEFQKKRGG